MSNNTVWSILEDGAGNIWFGTNAGACRYDGKAFTSIPISVTNGGNPDPFARKTLAGSQTAVWSILQDRAGRFWFGTSDGVYCYNGRSFTDFLDNPSVINNRALHLKAVSSIVEDKSGNIWLASWLREGVCRYDGNTLTSFAPNGDDMIHSILEHRNGNIWFGTRNHGAYRYDGKSFTSFADIEGFGASTVYSMVESKSGSIWFATENGSGQEGEDGGVWCYDGKSFIRFTTKQGLSHNGVFCIVEDKVGNLWFGTRGIGLCSYDGRAFTIFSK